MLKIKIGWVVFLALFFLGFSAWYGGNGKPITPEEGERLIEELYGYTDEYFNILPEAALEVRRVEPWRERGSSTAFYNRPAPDGSRPGIYYINQQDMNAVQKHIMNSLAYHEGAPGHHFQLAIQQELDGVPEFRKYGGYSAYSEGWALYAQQIADELGVYDDFPVGRLGYLQSLAFRACRLVVDTGLHAKRWDREQAITWLIERFSPRVISIISPLTGATY